MVLQSSLAWHLQGVYKASDRAGNILTKSFFFICLMQNDEQPGDPKSLIRISACSICPPNVPTIRSIIQSYCSPLS